MSNTGEVQPKVQTTFEESNVCSKVPDCPFTHVSCLHYDPVLRKGLCQPHENRHYKSARCSRLPSWFHGGWHVAVLVGGHLSLRRSEGGR